MSKRRVVITGLGVVSPLGNTVDSTWKALIEGKSGVGMITRFDATDFYCKIAGEVKDFDPSIAIDQKELKKIDLFSQFALVAAKEAWENSGLEQHNYMPSKSGCVLGIGIGGLMVLEKYHEAYLKDGPRKISPFLIPAMISNLGPGNIAIKYGLKGVNYAVTSACTSATHAIGEAYRLISSGLQDVMITGGSEAAVCTMGVGGFCALRALSGRNEDPEKASRPFDKDRDGFVLSEGSAILVLEDYEGAKSRGANILAELVGYGFSCDAYHMTAPCEDGEGAKACMTMALQDAGLNPSDIGYVNAHGTSTLYNDKTETLAIKGVFKDWARSGLLVSSTKSMTGHLLGAAGAIEAMFSVLAIRDNMIPPTINLDTPSEDCDLDYVPNVARQHRVDAVMSNSFGFGGTNASIIVRRV